MAEEKKPEERPTPDPAHRGTDVWSKIGWLQLFDRVVGTIKGGLPAFTHSIQVAAAGGPTCDIRRLWYLVCAAALGRFRNRVRTAGAAISMDATWDITGKVCSLEIAYQMNALSNLIKSKGGLADPGSGPLALMIRGPEQLTVGGDWTNAFVPILNRLGGGIRVVKTRAPVWIARLSDAIGGCVSTINHPTIRVFATGSMIDAHGGFSAPSVIPSRTLINAMRELPEQGEVTRGRSRTVIDALAGTATYLTAGKYPYRIILPAFDPPTSSESANIRVASVEVEALPDSGRIITTVEKNDARIQPPKPPVDGHTRCGLLALVAQALQTPCFLPSTPPCTMNPAASSGVYAQAPGTPSSADPVDLKSLWDTAPGAAVPWPMRGDQGPDGYPLSGAGTPVIGLGTNYAE